MKTIYVSADRTVVSFDGMSYHFSCIVRTNLGPANWCLRRLHEPHQVHYSEAKDGSQGRPVMPAVFPSGTCKVIDVIPGKGRDLGPVVVRTDACQELKVWALDANGGYDHETDELVMDYGYEFHADDDPEDGIFSVGCLHAASDPIAISFATAVRSALAVGPVNVEAA